MGYVLVFSPSRTLQFSIEHHEWVSINYTPHSEDCPFQARIIARSSHSQREPTMSGILIQIFIVTSPAHELDALELCLGEYTMRLHGLRFRPAHVIN